MSRSPVVPLTIAGGLLLATLPSAVLFFIDPRPFREVAGGAVHLSLYGLTLAAMLALLVAIPRLTELVSADGRRLPPGLLPAVMVTTALNAGTHFVQLFVTPFLADVAPVALDEQQSGMLMFGMVASWVAYLAAWAAVGAVAIRRGVLSWTCGLLLIVGSLTLPVIGPLASVALGAAFLLAARSAARTPRAAPEPAFAGA
jgi:hypothetical protein